MQQYSSFVRWPGGRVSTLAWRKQST